MSIFSRDQIPHLLERANWAILSAELSYLTPARNADRTRVLKAWLKIKDIPFFAATGRYNGVAERAVILPCICEADALEIARQFNQESILTRRGLVYTDGRVVPPAGPPEVVGSRSRGDRTRIDATGVCFRIPFNFG